MHGILFRAIYKYYLWRSNRFSIASTLFISPTWILILKRLGTRDSSRWKIHYFSHFEQFCEIVYFQLRLNLFPIFLILCQDIPLASNKVYRSEEYSFRGISQKNITLDVNSEFVKFELPKWYLEMYRRTCFYWRYNKHRAFCLQFSVYRLKA